MRRRDKDCGPIDLNGETAGEAVYLCLRRCGRPASSASSSSSIGSASRGGGQDVLLDLDDVSLLSGCPITDIQLFVPSKGEVAGQAVRSVENRLLEDDAPSQGNHANFVVRDEDLNSQIIWHTSFSNHRANLNSSSAGASVYLGYTRDTSILASTDGGGTSPLATTTSPLADSSSSSSSSSDGVSGGDGVLYTYPPTRPVAIVLPTVAPPAAPVTPTVTVGDDDSPSSRMSSDLGASKSPKVSRLRRSNSSPERSSFLIDALVAAPESIESLDLEMTTMAAGRRKDGRGERRRCGGRSEKQGKEKERQGSRRRSVRRRWSVRFFEVVAGGGRVRRRGGGVAAGAAAPTAAGTADGPAARGVPGRARGPAGAARAPRLLRRRRAERGRRRRRRRRHCCCCCCCCCCCEEEGALDGDSSGDGGRARGRRRAAAEKRQREQLE